MKTTAVSILRQTAPNWVSVSKMQGTMLEIVALPIRAGGILSRQYDLKIESYTDTSVLIKENPVGKLLPQSCPERHVNPDATFCLGLNAGRQVGSVDEGLIWWRQLEVFLDCQETVHNTGAWPSHAQLSHGAAGETELLAEELALKCELLEEYRRAVQFNSGVIADAAHFLEKKGRLRNSRSICLCGRKSKRGAPLLKKDCAQFKGQCLIFFEVQRRKQVNVFWQSFKQTCCGSVATCPLGK